MSNYPDDPGRQAQSGPDDQPWENAGNTADGARPLPPMGWYPDPADARQERYWDGAQWTRNTRQPPATQPVPAEPAQQWNQPADARRDVYGPTRQTYQAGPHYRTEAGFGFPSGPTTADGVRLAGWWSRFAALLVDYLLLDLLEGIVIQLAAPQVVTASEAWLNDVRLAMQSGASDFPTSPADPRYGITAQWYIMTGAIFLAQFVYATVLMHYKGATLGQLVMGLRVVPTGRGRDPFGLSWPVSLLRNVCWLVLQLLPLLPLTADLGGLPALVNGAWPLFNRRRQTLHDLVARTQVISTRP